MVSRGSPPSAHFGVRNHGGSAVAQFGSRGVARPDHYVEWREDGVEPHRGAASVRVTGDPVSTAPPRKGVLRVKSRRGSSLLHPFLGRLTVVTGPAQRLVVRRRPEQVRIPRGRLDVIGEHRQHAVASMQAVGIDAPRMLREALLRVTRPSGGCSRGRGHCLDAGRSRAVAGRGAACRGRGCGWCSLRAGRTGSGDSASSSQCGR